MRGFTLIEILIAMAVMLLLGAALATMYRSVITLHNYEKAVHSATESAGSIRQAVDEAARPADHIIASRTFASGSFTTGTTTVIFEAPSVDASGSVVSGHYDYTALYLTASTVYRISEPDAASARRAGTTALGDVTSLAFTYDSATTSAITAVTLDVTASSTVKGNGAASHLKETVRLRNI